MVSKTVIDKYALFVLQITAHAGLVAQIIYGTWYHWLITAFIYLLTGCFGMTMTYHRLLSHRSWKAPRWFEIFGTICGTYGLTGSSIAWVAIHREHHHHTDDEQDPHSPIHKGFARVQWFSMFEKPNPRYALHLIRDPLHAQLHQHYVIIHLAILTILFYIDPMLCLCLYLAPAAVLWNAGSFINTITHMTGYRNHQNADHSTNVWWLGYLMWGEGWHNNHHHSPNNARFGEKWWEVDLGHAFIRMLDRNTSND